MVAWEQHRSIWSAILLKGQLNLEICAFVSNLNRNERNDWGDYVWLCEMVRGNYMIWTMLWGMRWSRDGDSGGVKTIRIKRIEWLWEIFAKRNSVSLWDGFSDDLKKWSQNREFSMARAFILRECRFVRRDHTLKPQTPTPCYPPGGFSQFPSGSFCVDFLCLGWSRGSFFRWSDSFEISAVRRVMGECWIENIRSGKPYLSLWNPVLLRKARGVMHYWRIWSLMCPLTSRGHSNSFCCDHKEWWSFFHSWKADKFLLHTRPLDKGKSTSILPVDRLLKSGYVALFLTWID
jgi:hypothetical protein